MVSASPLLPPELAFGGVPLKLRPAPARWPKDAEYRLIICGAARGLPDADCSCEWGMDDSSNGESSSNVGGSCAGELGLVANGGRGSCATAVEELDRWNDPLTGEVTSCRYDPAEVPMTADEAAGRPGNSASLVNERPVCEENDPVRVSDEPGRASELFPPR